MTGILNDFLMFACATALVTGIVLAIASIHDQAHRFKVELRVNFRLSLTHLQLHQNT
jgi:hypothetical protein